MSEGYEVPTELPGSTGFLFKIPGSGFVFAAFDYPSITNKEIIQYTSSLLFTQVPIRIYLDGTIIDSRTILVTMYYCGYVGL